MLSTENLTGTTQEETQEQTEQAMSPPSVKRQKIVGVLRFRASAKEVKSAVMYSSSPFQERSPNTFLKIKSSLHHNASQVAHNRPIKKVLEVSSNGTPRKILTPGNTKLFLKKDYGIVRIFTEETNLPQSPAQPTIMEICSEKKKQIENSNAYQHIKLNSHNIKQQELWITAAQIEKAKEEIAANHGKRICSQKKVMVQEGLAENKGSANDYGKEFLANLKIKYYEWLHLIQHKLLASAGQKEENLVCGSFHANTDMMFIEFQHALLSKHYPKGYKLEVIANVVQGLDGSQFSTTIDYIIETDDFRLPFRFNGQSDVLPNIFNLNYVEAMILASIPMLNLNKMENPENSLIFFSKNRKRKLVYQEDNQIVKANP